MSPSFLATAGMLLNSQFSSNYFSVSQVEQNFDEFEAEFAGACSFRCTRHKQHLVHTFRATSSCAAPPPPPQPERALCCAAKAAGVRAVHASSPPRPQPLPMLHTARHLHPTAPPHPYTHTRAAPPTPPHTHAPPPGPPAQSWDPCQAPTPSGGSTAPRTTATRGRTRPRSSSRPPSAERWELSARG